MSHLSTMLRIEATAEAVFDLIADPARSAEWQTLLIEMSDIAGRPGGIGSSFVGSYRVVGRKLAGRFVVTAAERPRAFQLDGTTTGGWVRWRTMIEPDGRACAVQVSLEYELPGEIVGSLLSLLTGNRLEREFRCTYDNLKRVAETGAAVISTGAATVSTGAAVISAGAQAGPATEREAADPGGRLATT